MPEKKNKNQPLEVRLRIDGLELVAEPGKRSADFDLLLERNKANSFVFIPLAKSRGKKRHKRSRPDPISRKKKLPEGNWLDGEFRNSAPRCSRDRGNGRSQTICVGHAPGAGRKTLHEAL